MMEILFRGKRTGDGQWVYGYYFAKPILEKHFIEIGEEQFLVDPKTVGQYTGMADKNGTRIFEGDIMSFGAYGIDYVGKVEFIDGNFCIACKSAYPFLDDAIKRHEAVKVGNIHDNPELLEATK